MPLSKTKNRERMSQARLHARLERLIVQPIFTKEEANRAMNHVLSPELDADGNPVPEFT